jgi:hypothetical protein
MSREAKRLLEREWTFAIETSLKILPFEQFGNDTRSAVDGLKHIDYVDNIVRANASHRSYFPFKPLQGGGFAGVAAVHHLDGEATIEANVIRLVELAHPARRENALQAVRRADDGAK